MSNLAWAWTGKPSRDPDQRFQSAPELAEAFASLALDKAASTPAAIASTPEVIAPLPPVIVSGAPAAPPPIELTVRMAPTPAIPAPEPLPPPFEIGVPAALWHPGGIESPIPYPTTSLRRGPIQADPRPPLVVDPPPQAFAPTVAVPASGRPSWPVRAIAATVALALIVGLALRWRATSASVEATLAPSASAPVEAAPSPSATGSLDPGTTTAPLASAAAPRPSAAPRAPIPSAAPPRVSPRSRPNPLDRSD